MLQEYVQSLVFVVDIVDKSMSGSDPAWSLFNPDGTQRIRVREIYTFLVPESKFEDEIPDECEQEVIFEDVLEFSSGGENFRQITRAVELEYGVIDAGIGGSVTIEGDRIVFNNAGLRCLSAPCGPAYAGGCRHRPSVIVKAITSFLQSTGENDELYAYWQEYLWAALGDCYNELFGEERGDLKAVDDVGKRVYYFHTDAFLPEPNQARGGDELSGNVLTGVFPLPSVLLDQQPNLQNTFLRPLIWYPFVDEAFAFGAITAGDRFRLFGRMGALTRGYRVTPDTHWWTVANEPRPLTFAEDVDPSGTFKYAEFDAGALPPGDHNIGLQQASIRLYDSGVPFYIGAMPLADPEGIGRGDLEELHKTDFAYLEGVLDTPIVFDPMVNCQACN